MSSEDPRLEDEGIPDHAGPLPSKEATGDAQEGLIPPADRPQAADRRGTTAREHREGPSFDERISWERRGREPRGGRPEAGQLVEEGGGGPDEEKDLAAEEVEGSPGRSAEEAAVRVDQEAPGGVDRARDSYLEEEEEA
ncbi:MAG TPA: hypothetical protein VNO79_01245 [Actinomycetota bacterium]|nr:hypothetical protein [Actinomycetota bacterium]